MLGSSSLPPPNRSSQCQSHCDENCIVHHVCIVYYVIHIMYCVLCIMVCIVYCVLCFVYCVSWCVLCIVYCVSWCVGSLPNEADSRHNSQQSSPPTKENISMMRDVWSLSLQPRPDFSNDLKKKLCAKVFLGGTQRNHH